MHTERKGEAYLSLAPASMQAIHGQGGTIEQINIEITSIYQDGLSLYHQERYEEAESMFQRALQRQEKVLGSDHTDTLDSAVWLGLCLYRQKRYNEAESMFQRALQGREKVLGSDHTDTLDSAHYLGKSLYYQNQCKEAESMFRRALQGREKMLGREHPDTLSSVNDLGLVLSRQGKCRNINPMIRRNCAHTRTKYDEAEAMHRRALEGYEKVLGREHPSTLL
ncbi:hypothetical protein ZTR_09465 [Talaromyces verruculosus]|nr:hypothetical protein ZTR_09465 [Talaromyces verruculosus]